MAKSKIKLARKIIDELNQEIGIPTIIIRPDTNKEITLTGSKFGGLPYWDSSRPYPTDRDGNRLKLIAQFNLGEVCEACHGDVGLLPKQGILQFFLASGETYGSDFDDYTDSNGFRVIYHPAVDPTITAEDVAAMDIPSTDTTFDIDDAVHGQTALSFSVEKRAAIGYGGFMEAFILKAAEQGWTIDGEADEDPYDYLDEDVADELYDHAVTDENCLLGSPLFQQLSDPRQDDDRYAAYDTQLMQMLSTDSDTGAYSAAWGDMGSCHFFINRDRLAAGDFSDILYYWDCF